MANFWKFFLPALAAAVVAAVLFPVFSQVQHPFRSNCTFNMKQIGLAILQYTQDYDNDLPNASFSKDGKNSWRTALWPYTKSTGLFQCDERKTHKLAIDGYSVSYSANYSGNYSGMKSDQGNGVFAGYKAQPINILDLKTPASLVCLCETDRNDKSEFNIENPAEASWLWAGREGHGTYLFSDGHVKVLKPMQTINWWYRNNAKPLSVNGQAVLKATEERYKPKKTWY